MSRTTASTGWVVRATVAVAAHPSLWFTAVRQVLLYTTGLDDQEFVVAYETEDLYSYQGLLIALRSTEARRSTSRATTTRSP